MSDWADHLTTCFPEARIKKFMEMRGADGGPWNRICALPAFWVGLMYDNNSLDAAWDICKNWNLDTREEMRLKVSVDGLNARVGNIEMIDLASNILSVSNAGLISRSKLGGGGYNETHFLSALQESIETGKTPADELLDKYNGDWNGNLNKIYSEFSY
jgi:glutamate--cysteine ligase